MPTSSILKYKTPKKNKIALQLALCLVFRSHVELNVKYWTYLSCWSLDSNAEGDAGRVSHGANGEEVALVPLASALPDFEQLPRQHSCCRNDNVSVLEVAHDQAHGFLPPKRIPRGAVN
jgi:hypothetical protein